ncbi:MAG TPA: lysylphosphatidylglycerol synthase transmembrane domain-containing protein [Vicinamibacteria bacterium]|nr:lysylphosphatidylglycerol synthase transmembrane domain-containing protein [Vicinamibacteria bacterium]
MSRSSRLRLAFGVALALTLMAFVFKGTDWPKLREALRGADALDLTLVAAAALLTYLLRAWRWGYIIAPMARVPLADLFSATCVGFMTALVIPRAGEIVRPYLIARRHPVSTSSGVATIILERLFDLLTVLVLFALYLFVLPVPRAQTSGSLMSVVKVGGAVAGVAAVAILLLLVGFHARAEQAMAFFERVLRVFPPRLALVAAGILRAFGFGLAVFKAPLPHLLAIVAQSFLVWLSIAFSVWISIRAFGVLLPFHSAFLIIAFLTVGVAIPTPGNVGGFHAFFVSALVGVYGASAEVAQAAALACHALTNLPVLVLGVLFLGREGLSLGRVAQMTEENRAGGVPATEASR